LLVDGPSLTACKAPTHWSGPDWSAVFFLLSLIKTARGLGLLHGFGEFLRGIFKELGGYEGRRTLQIAASIGVAIEVMALIIWHRIRRYRLAVGFAGLTAGFGVISFISLHEVDAWNATAPWARTAVDLVAAAGISAVAIAWLYQLRNFSGTPSRDGTPMPSGEGVDCRRGAADRRQHRAAAGCWGRVSRTEPAGAVAK
jgi:hypothetical protein